MVRRTVPHLFSNLDVWSNLELQQNDSLKSPDHPGLSAWPDTDPHHHFDGWFQLRITQLMIECNPTSGLSVP